MSAPLASGGLRRLPAFLRDLTAAVASESAPRAAARPALLNPHARWDVLLVALACSVLFLAARLLLNRVLAPRLFAHRGPKLHPKLAENLFYTVYYALAFAFYAAVVRPAVDWRVDLLDGTRGFNVLRAVVEPMPPPMVQAEQLYYAQAAGFYLSATVFLVMFDSRRSDFGEFLVHHAVTLGLIGISYAYGYVRAGVVVLALHDAADIFLYAAKLVHYLGFAGWDTMLFSVFAAAFYGTRLVMFPRLVYAAAVETLQLVIERPSFNAWARWFDIYLWHYACFAGLLGTLQVLHCFWFALVLKMVYREVFLGKKITEVGDIRSDDEGDGEDAGEEEEEDGFFDNREEVVSKGTTR